MPPIITPEFVRNAINYRHPNYTATVELAEAIKIHADGLFPDKLIAERRPSESKAIFEYRKKIYKSVTKKEIGKVLTELQKIRRSQDWNISYNDDDIPKKISGDETLERYCEENYPGFSSLTNWAFSELLRRYLIDANSIIALVLKNMPAQSNEYIKPIVEVFSSEQVLDYVEGGYVVLKSADKNVYRAGNNRIYQGDIIYIITMEQILRYKQVTGKYDLELDLEYNHNLGYLPAFKAGGEYKCRVNNDTIYESRIQYMVPELDEAAREYSDLQAEIVQHIHSEKYYYTNTDCPDCNGAGKLKNKSTCSKCTGSGRITNVSPYGVFLVDMAKAGEAQAPTPPIGYIYKDTKIAELQDQRVDKHLYKALASINMEFLSNVSLNQSGVAKEVDRDALNTFVSSIAEDIVRILDNAYRFICDVRYSVIITDKEARQNLLPRIAVPERFDLLNSSYLMGEIREANTAQVNPVVKKNMEVEFIRKRYNADPDKADELQCIFDMDPFYGNSQDEKMTMLSNGGITEVDYVISCNIVQLVNIAINENDNFLRKTFKEKREIIKTYAQAIIAENTPQNTIKVELNGEGSSEGTEDNI
ncbi:hypothetical protein CLV62_12511 [Dysgonomonas alginatilytica]|uniref:Uncharacterized protein n=1 Tax=Dysgonomonas alginatilytica TaxID=1605892 RepID=A0A2V3PM56_9BACT|nr:hypothetical protein [Dysgonomonas alginatilytica]PXV61178.1 hypothetical protein CLV62_12511 [Dysgonomonas alginatilytica]